jgi:hypothetical protein
MKNETDRPESHYKYGYDWPLGETGLRLGDARYADLVAYIATHKKAIAQAQKELDALKRAVHKETEK